MKRGLAVGSVAGLAALAIVAATRDADRSTRGVSAPPGVAATAVVECGNAIEVAATPADEVVIVGDAVAVAGGDPVPMSGPLAYSVKSGLLARGSASVEIAVPSAYRDVIALDWGGRASRLEIRPCRRPGWTVWAGAIEVAKPACIPLDVRVGARRTRVDVGVGARCDT